MVIFDAAKGEVADSVPGLGGSGETAYDPKLGLYYAAAGGIPGGPAIKVIDPKAKTLVQRNKGLRRRAFARARASPMITSICRRRRRAGRAEAAFSSMRRSEGACSLLHAAQCNGSALRVKTACAK